MFKEMSVADLRELTSDTDSLVRETFDPRTTKTRFVFDGQITLQHNGHQYGMRSEAYVRICQILGIPGAYVQKTPHEIMVPHVNFWLHNSDVTQITFASDPKSDVLQVFSANTIPPVSNEIILDSVERNMGSGVTAYHVDHDIDFTRYSIVPAGFQPKDRAKHEVAKGDIVMMGVSIENSYSQKTPLTVAAYAHRLICTNGAISVDTMYRMPRNTATVEISDWIDQCLSEVISNMDSEMARLRSLRSVQLSEHLSDALQSIFSTFSVPTQIRDLVTKAVIDKKASTLYDVYNIVTDIASNDVEVSSHPDLSSRLMRIGGRISAHREFCDSCHRVMT